MTIDTNVQDVKTIPVLKTVTVFDHKGVVISKRLYMYRANARWMHTVPLVESLRDDNPPALMTLEHVQDL